MPRLKINTAPSLYDPIEVEIDKKTYRVRRLTRDLLKEVAEVDARVKDGNLDAAFDRLKLFLPDIKPKAISSLDLSDVAKITQFIIENSFKIRGEEKNAPGPEQEKSPL